MVSSGPPQFRFSMGLVLGLSLVLAVALPVLLLRTLVRDSSRQAVEGEAVRLSLGILGAARLGFDEHLDQMGKAASGGRLTGDGTRYHLLFRPVPLGQGYLVRPKAGGATVYRLDLVPGTPEPPAGADFNLTAVSSQFKAGGQTLEVLKEGAGRQLWVGRLPFLPEAPPGFWLVSLCSGDSGLLAMPVAPDYLGAWLKHLSRAVAAEVSLVTADNCVLGDDPGLFRQPWAALALSRSKEGEFFTVPSGNVLVHVYADPDYLYNLVAVTPRQGLTAAVDGVIDQTTVVTALVAVVLGLVTLGLLLVFSRHLRRLTAQLSALASGQYRGLSAGPGPWLTETDTIARGITVLAGRLEENRLAIDEGRQDLERKVADRTATLSRALEELKAAQESLVQTEKMAALGRTVAAFTHEINNPLGSALTVIGLLESNVGSLNQSLQAGTLTSEDLADRLGTLGEATAMVQKSLQRAIDVTGSVKHVAADQSRTEIRRYDLAGYLGEVAAALGPMLRHSIHTLELQGDPGIELVGNPAVLYQIFSNLVLNSVKHGFEGRPHGAIRIGARRVGTEVVLDYRDDGNGMDAQQLSRMYEPFYTTKRAEGGTGLGMSIVYNLVRDELGGQIHCESKPGKGVQFTIRFPVPEKEAPDGDKS